MRILYLSPGFPPGSHLFCAAARARGASVVGVGDMPESDMPPGARDALDRYVFEPRMGEYDVLLGIVRTLVAEHGPIDFVESNGEHWLEVEGRLRDDLGIAGLGASDVRRLRSKLAMAEAFQRAGVPHPPGIRCGSPDAVRAFAAEHGFPLVFKPDSGSGASHTFRVSSAAELDAALRQPLDGHVVQPFVEGVITTFDGLVDQAGRVVFCTSHTYDRGIMEVRTGTLDGYYYSRRDIPAALERLGRQALAAFELRRRFFHLEFFERPDGSYVALEMNVRPPGGFTTDMMSIACGFDVYDLWAAVLLGQPLDGFAYERRFHTAHAGRRHDRAYEVAAEALPGLLGETLALVRPIPAAFAVTMGDTMYLLRHRELERLLAAIHTVQQPRR
ncbi:ATP-grasp domain-containing protein [Piscinibacter koreensis]|uniref:ATP-grasp domain-containing protein n=1 Tax=Piscinibacter koreensis TaxID=2742824 RepID=A0A7Y6TW78_9BURK|nr:ATP-grasp domain-containing protein [Schlegelella koreensis]NUZ05795.1 ATP-grasp domain-containing protein [Schlegelella koreensis]